MRNGTWRFWKAIAYFLLVTIPLIGSSRPRAQELLKAIEPGTGYSRLKQWAIEHRLVFENFTKDTLVILGPFQESGDADPYLINILSRFCAGDDYAGRAFSIILQQKIEFNQRGDRVIRGDRLVEVFGKYRTYIDALAGKSSEDGRFTGDYKMRRERMNELKGIAVGATSEQGGWEVGLFSHPSFLLIQVTRSKDELCK
jgi:hypothetical protein